MRKNRIYTTNVKKPQPQVQKNIGKVNTHVTTAHEIRMMNPAYIRR